MSIEAARELAEMILCELVNMGIISGQRYGRITEEENTHLAEEVQSKGESLGL